MLFRLKQKIIDVIGEYLDEIIDEVLLQKGIPSSKEWEQRLKILQEKEDWLKKAYVQYREERKIEPPPNVVIEHDFCSLCVRPHFQEGLCLVHFHQRYSKS